jgi:hypothetical protein
MIKIRNYNNDYLKVMKFLREMYLEKRLQRCWLPQRWEYAEHFITHLSVEHGDIHWHNYIKIWEENEKIVGICHKEDGNNAFIQLRNGYEYLTEEILEYAEENISYNNDGKKRLNVWSLESDTYRNELLLKRGYIKGEDGNYYNAQYLDKDYIPKLPTEYTFLTAEDKSFNALQRHTAVFRGFHPEGENPKKIPNSFLMMEKAPLFRPEFEIMTKYKDNTIASFSIVWYDEETKTGMFEPVATHPKHLKKGLGKAMLIEGLRKLKEIGAIQAYVESYGNDRKAFYNSAGFESFDKDWHWTKEW